MNLRSQTHAPHMARIDCAGSAPCGIEAAEVQDAPESVRNLHQELLTLVEAVLPLTEEALSLVAAYEAR